MPQRPALHRRDFLRLSLAASAGVCLSRPGSAGPTNAKGAGGRPPNIILLLADDMGWMDPSCFGNDRIATPNLDALARAGTRLTQFYAASAVCTPTRASILTGRYPLRFDIRKHFSDGPEHLPPGTVTLGKLLKKRGYLCGHVGKWHLGGLHVEHLADRQAGRPTTPGPTEHGFDDYQCQIEQQPLRGKLGRARRLYRDGGTCLIRNDRRLPSDPRHFTDINGSEAVRLIEKYHKAGPGKPFFVNAWFLVPHTPYEPAPEPHLSKYKGKAKGDQLLFRSMVSHMDAQVGRIVATLKKLGRYDNTLIWFTSDNGGAYEANLGPLKGGKTDLHEGGLRVPALAVWPGRIPAGKTTATLGHACDLLPTFCAAAGADLPRDVTFDGINLLPHLTEGKPIAAEQRGTVFWQIDLYRHLQRHYPKPKPYATEVARHGRWKLLAKNGKPVELFDVESDLPERKNVLDKHPDVARKLAAEIKQWLAEPRRGWKTHGFKAK